MISGTYVGVLSAAETLGVVGTVSVGIRGAGFVRVTHAVSHNKLRVRAIVRFIIFSFKVDSMILKNLVRVTRIMLAWN